MGAFDKIKQATSKVGDIDTSEGHEFGHGFDREVCEGCQHKQEGTPETCGLCGCPLFNLDKTDAPPSSCPKLDDHEQP
jgi:hypothetical protein